MKRDRGYSFRSALKLMGKLKAYAAHMTVTVFSGILNQLSIIFVSVLCAYIAALALEGRLASQFSSLLAALFAAVALRVVFYFTEMWLAHYIAFKILRDFRVALLEAIERVSPAMLLGMRSGQLASTLMSDVELLEWFFAHSFGSLVVAVATPALLLVLLGTIHFLLPWVALAFLGVLVTIPFIMKRKASEQGLAAREELGEANAITVEGVQGMREILMLNQVGAYRAKNRKYMQRMYDSQLTYSQRLGTEGAALQIVAGFSMVAVTGIASWLTLNGQVDFSYFPAIVILAGMTFNPVIEICNTARNFGLIFAASWRVFQVMEAKASVEDTGKDMDTSNLSKDICFDHVDFRYGPQAPNAIEDVSFTVKQGETLALVGHSGAGKSTCINLLLRYWDPDKGAIRIGGCDLRDMTFDNLRELTSPVLQDVFLFHDTLRENIRLGRQTASDEEVVEAAKSALIHDFIMSLPKGYDAMAGERGARLSGGQRQRIAIARAILKGSPILILDEAVSNLDTESEAEIHQVLARQPNLTKLIVAHRLSTILSADRLAVFHEGRIAQTGTHKELMSVPGRYRDLIANQTLRSDGKI